MYPNPLRRCFLPFSRTRNPLTLSATPTMLLLPRPSLYRSPAPAPAMIFSSPSVTHLRVFPANPFRTGRGGMGLGIRCMAKERRVRMVAKQIRRELSQMLLTDKVLQFAVLPEASLGADRYLSSLTTISDVEVSGDLQVVKVYVSIFGDERGREVAMAGLKSKAKYVRSELGRRMKLRLTPEIRFIEDESLERGSRVIAILDRLKSERENPERQDTEQSEPSYLSDDDGESDQDGTDEGIIYIE